MNKNIQNIAKSVLQKIQAEDVTMHSRYYFLLRSAMWIIAAIFLFGLTLYITSMIGFIFIGNGMGALAGFGMAGVFIMLRSLPWLLILIALGLVFLLEYLGAQFSFIYKKPLVYSLLGVSVLMVVGGTLLAQTSMHHRAFALGEEYKVPGAGRIYQEYVLRRDGEVYIGTISTITDSAVNLMLRNGESKLLGLTEDTKRSPRRALEQGMMVMVMVGSDDDGTEKALGIRPLERKHMLMPRRHSR